MNIPGFKAEAALFQDESGGNTFYFSNHSNSLATVVSVAASSLAECLESCGKSNPFLKKRVARCNKLRLDPEAFASCITECSAYPDNKAIEFCRNKCKGYLKHEHQISGGHIN